MTPLDHEPEGCVFARKAAGLTLTEAAKQMDMAVSLLSEIEKGTRNLTPARMQALARVYNCPVVVLQRKREAVPA